MEENGSESLKLKQFVPEKIAGLKPSVQIFLFAATVTLLSVIHYISTLLNWTHIGFTLDDSWIHVQYARTIFEGRPWEYSPGTPSTGSTSPLWSVIISTAFLFTQDPEWIVWVVIIISAALYICSTFLVGLLADKYIENHSWAFPAMLGFVLVPRNSWLMLSGMEFPIFMFLILLTFLLLEKGEQRYDILLGIVGGLLYLSRPEGFILVAIAFPFRFLRTWKRGDLDWQRLLSLVGMGILAALIVLPWVMHCLNVTGHPLPDTFYVKLHAPTADDIETWTLWWIVFLITLPFIPTGLAFGLYLLIKARSPSASMWTFVVVMIVIYGTTAVMQSLVNNARYLVPLFALLQILTVVGIGILTERMNQDPYWSQGRLTARTTGLILVAILLIPPLIGYMEQANLYGNAAKNINEQQVVIGEWINENIPEGEVIALHDAGAIAFFGNRPIIDLIGLTTPDMVHLNITFRERILYIRDHGCNYLVTFDRLFVAWSNQLISGWTILFSVHLEDNVISGGDTKSVYFINWSHTAFAP